MRRHKRRRHLPDPPAQDGAPALAASEARLEAAERHVIAPLEEFRKQNNVTALVEALVRPRGGKRGRRPATS